MNETTFLVSPSSATKTMTTWATTPGSVSSSSVSDKLSNTRNYNSNDIGFSYQNDDVVVMVKERYDDEEKRMGSNGDDDADEEEEEEELVELRTLMMKNRASSSSSSLSLFWSNVYSHWREPPKMNTNSKSTRSSSKGARCSFKTLFLSALFGCTLLLGLAHYCYDYSSSGSSRSRWTTSPYFLTKESSWSSISIVLGAAAGPPEKDVVLKKRQKGIIPIKKANDTNHRKARTMTFGQLAQHMLPDYYSNMLDGLVIITDKVMPDQIYTQRKTILETRDLMDVFSPVYPPTMTLTTASNITHATNNKEDDMWRRLRTYLDDGYTVLGDFQDLYSSHANYTLDFFDTLQGNVFLWNVEFAIFRETHNMSAYLSSPSLTSTYYSHDHESKLFWRRVPNLPHGNTLATTALHSLGAEQVHTTLEYMKKIASLKSVLNTVSHAEYHEVRKLLRSLQDEYKLFGSLMFPDKDDNSNNDTNDTNDNSTSRVEAAIAEIDRARHLLGDMNDHYVAHTISDLLNTTSAQEQEQLAQQIQDEWDDVKRWMRETDLEGTLKALQHSFLSTEQPGKS